MRTRINNYTFTPNTRSISTGINDLNIEDIRLVVNETQKVVIVSSMQKDHIARVANGVITYTESYEKKGERITIPTLAEGDNLTIEIDKGAVPVYAEISSQDILDICDRIINSNNE